MLSTVTLLLLLLHRIECTFDAEVNEEKLKNWANHVASKNVGLLLAEFNMLENGPGQSTAFHKNSKLNRYNDFVCLDATRVILETGHPYIHANRVGYSSKDQQSFIATQCPMLGKQRMEVVVKENTIFDFWSMVLQERVDTIVMLCDVEASTESGDQGCIKYWPDGGEQNHCMNSVEGEEHCVHVRAEGVEKKLNDFLVQRSISVKFKPDLRPKNAQKALLVEHIQWLGWPDHGVPEQNHDPMELLRILEHKQRIIVHCSAGVGRTGTILALQLSMDKLKENKDLNVQEVVKELRSQRARSVQKDVQYLYIYSVLLRFAMSKKFDGLDVNAVNEILKKIQEFGTPKAVPLMVLPKHLRLKNRPGVAVPV